MNRDRVRKTDGFTLAETLAAVLIMSFAGLMIVTGIVAFTRSWWKITDKANAQVYVSTLAIRMQDELEFASEVGVKGESVVWFADDQTGYTSMFEPGRGTASSFGIKRSDDSAGLASASVEAFVPEAMGGGRMYVTYDSLTYGKNTHVFEIKNLKAVEAVDSENKVLYQVDSVKIKNLNDAVAVAGE